MSKRSRKPWEYSHSVHHVGGADWRDSYYAGVLPSGESEIIDRKLADEIQEYWILWGATREIEDERNRSRR